MTCDLCLDIITDLDSWLTSDATEDQIVEWMSQVCKTLGELVSPDLETLCLVVLGANLPPIIDDLVNQNLDPRQVCESLGYC